ncbi:MAG TPA: hypothetical protein VKC17_09695 [Sphingomicrobium sp.]|nr:hypothetical protein [Sphingomicrobium sp.]
MRPDAQAELIGELKRLSDRELRLTLGQLSPGERDQVLALIEEPETPEPPAPSFETLVGLSPWLLKAIEGAREPNVAAKPLTPATRSALFDSLGRISNVRSSNATQRPAHDTFVGRLLARRKAVS